MKWTRAMRYVAAIVALLLVAAACGDNKGSTASSGNLTKVKLQLQWVTCSGAYDKVTRTSPQ